MTTTFLNLKTRFSELIGDSDRSYGRYYNDAINGAARETHTSLFRYLHDRSLVTGNGLPNSHFEDWAATTIPDLYTVSTGGCAEETTNIRGQRGTSSVKVTAGAAGDKMYISSTTWPQLLDYAGRTISFRCWAYPQTVNDAFVEIYTKKETSTGTVTQTLTSTATTDITTGWTLLELEDQSINSGITLIQFHFKVLTNGQYSYFDNARVTGKDLSEFLLPTPFKNGTLCSVKYQVTGDADQISDDLHITPEFAHIWGWDIVSDGTYEYLRLPRKITSDRALELMGYCPLEDDMAADTDTMSIDGEHVELLLMKAAAILYRRLRGIVSSDSRGQYDYEFRFWENEYQRNCHRLKMVKPAMQLKMR